MSVNFCTIEKCKMVLGLGYGKLFIHDQINVTTVCWGFGTESTDYNWFLLTKGSLQKKVSIMYK